MKAVHSFIQQTNPEYLIGYRNYYKHCRYIIEHDSKGLSSYKVSLPAG